MYDEMCEPDAELMNPDIMRPETRGEFTGRADLKRCTGAYHLFSKPFILALMVIIYSISYI